MVSLADRVRVVRADIERACAACGRDPGEVRLLPVSKRHPTERILEAQKLGLTEFGENRVQELSAKAVELAGHGIRWHLIGSLQTNKVNLMLGVEGLVLLHSLDRVKLADALQHALAQRGRTLPVLLQIDATGEASKHGVEPRKAAALLDHVARDCPAVEPIGVMAMGPLHGDPVPVFEAVARLHQELRQRSGLALPEASMGMTGDMAAAIAAGSTLVRVGTGVFGPRPQ